MYSISLGMILENACEPPEVRSPGIMKKYRIKSNYRVALERTLDGENPEKIYLKEIWSNFDGTSFQCLAIVPEEVSGVSMDIGYMIQR